MKKIVSILLAAVVAVMVNGCASENKFTITGGGVESVHLGPTITATANLTFSNPSYKVKVSDVSGVVKNGEDALLNLTAEDFTIPARSTTTVPVPVEGSLAPGVGLLKIMSLVSGSNFEGLTADLTFTATGLLGIKKTQTIEGIPLKELMDLL